MNHKHLTISATTVALIATTGVIIFAMQSKNTDWTKTPKYKTYFTYTDKEINQIKHAKKETLFTTFNQLRETRNQMFERIKFENTQPTLAAKYYAYLLIAQNEAFKVTKNANIEMDSITTTTDQVNCIFFPQLCKDPNYSNSAEKLVAEIVTKKINDRIKEDETKTAEYVKTMKPMADKWYRFDVITPEAGAWKPWHISSPNDFLPPPPPPDGSEEDKKQIAIVKKAVIEATQEQKEKVKYWAGGSNTVTPAGLWLVIANDYMNLHQIPMEKNLEVNAQLATTLEDAMISCWNSKYTYQTDRPDMKDPTIKTLIQNPNFPSYVSGHSTISAAAATVLTYFFPENKDEWFRMANEAKNSRLWAGIHFQIDNDQGFKMGEQIGQTAIKDF